MSRGLLGVPQVRTRAATADATRVAASGADGEAVPERGGTTTEVEVQSWVDKVKDAIPVEVVVAWAAIEAFIGQGDAVGSTAYLSLVGVMAVGTLAYLWVNVETPTEGMADDLGVPFAYLRDARRAQIALGVGAFLVWTYYLGGVYGRPFAGFHDATAAQVVMVLYVFFGPQLVPNVVRKLHGVEIPDGDRRPPAQFPGGE